MGLLKNKKKDKAEEKKELGELYKRELRIELSDDELEKVSGGMTHKQL